MKITKYFALMFVLVLVFGVALSPAYAAPGRSLKGAISGVVLDPAGRTMPGVEVQVWKPFPTGLYSSDWQPYSTGVQTARNGSFKISVPPGTYRVWFKPADLTAYCMEAYPDAALPYWGDDVVVTAGRTTSRVNVQIDGNPGALSGTVYDAVTGELLSGIPVNLGIQGFAIVNMEFGRVLSAADGSYSLGGLKPAMWTIWANPGWDSESDPRYCELYLPTESWTDAGAVTQIDADLEPVGFPSVSGYVLDGTTGLGVPNVNVTPVYLDAWSGEWSHEPGWSATTDEFGYFEMINVPAGWLMLWADGNNLYQQQYYHGDWQYGEQLWYERGHALSVSEFYVWPAPPE